MSTRALAQGGILTGVSIVILYLASFMQIASWAITMLVGFIPAVFFLRGQFKVGTVQYAATSLVSLFILPDKVLAILYTFLFGLYTVLRFQLERRTGKVVSWIAKFLFAELWVAGVCKLIQIGLLPEIPTLTPTAALLLVTAGALLILYYDFCLGRIFVGLGIYLKRIKF